MNDWTQIGRNTCTVAALFACLGLIAAMPAGCATPPMPAPAAPAQTAQPSPSELAMMQPYRVQKEAQLALVKPAIYMGGDVFIRLPPADALSKPPYSKDDSSASLHRKDLMTAVWNMDYEFRRDALLRTSAFDRVVLGGPGEQPPGTFKFIVSCNGTVWLLAPASGGPSREFARSLDMEHFAEQVVAAAREMARQ